MIRNISSSRDSKDMRTELEDERINIAASKKFIILPKTQNIKKIKLIPVTQLHHKIP